MYLVSLLYLQIPHAIILLIVLIPLQFIPPLFVKKIYILNLLQINLIPSYLNLFLNIRKNKINKKCTQLAELPCMIFNFSEIKKVFRLCSPFKGFLNFYY